MTTEFNFLKEWIINFLSKPQSVLNDLPPCPYAKRALLDNKIYFFKSVNYYQDICNLFENWNESYDVAVCVAPDDVDPISFADTVKKINNEFMSKGFVCLEDHKEVPENFYELTFNNGKYNIILCQKKEKLNKANLDLQKIGYYKNWSEEMLNDVVNWRFN